MHAPIEFGLSKYAPALNELSYRPEAVPHYEMMSGALLWDDEKVEIPFSAIGWFRALLAYRSSVILAKPRTEFEAIWKEVQKLAPRWPGFRDERCTPSSELANLLAQFKKKTARDCRRLTRAASGKWRPLSGGSENALPGA